MGKKLSLWSLVLTTAIGAAALPQPADSQAPAPSTGPTTTAAADTIDLRRSTTPANQLQTAGSAPVPAPGSVPTYYIQGKPVSVEKYKAALLAAEALGLMKQNLNEQAATKLTEALKLSPDLPEAHHNLGLVMAKLGDVPHAIDELNTAIRLKPDLDSSWLTLGGLHQSVGHISEAIATYKQFLERFPKHSMRDKITNLVIGLTAEQKTMNAARNAQAALLPPGNTHSVLQVPSDSPSDDYVADVTRAGVLRWPPSRIPIQVYLHPPVLVDRITKQPTGYKSDYQDILIKSFEDWSQASNGAVKFVFVDNPKDATLDCLWVANPDELTNKAEAGEARVFSDKDGLAKGTIRLLTKSLSSVLPLTNNRMRVICLHEIGHALGLAGHTANPDDAMFYSVSFKDEWKDLSGRDARTIRRLYSGN